MDTRQSDVDKVINLADTCGWILNEPEFKSWRERKNVDEHKGLLWIQGHPGSGESVIMKKILTVVTQEEEKSNSAAAILSYFFNARSEDRLDKTMVGMLRTLIHQLLQEEDDLRDEFVRKYVRRNETQGPDWKWRLSELKELLLSVLSKSRTRPMYLVIDALNENARGQDIDECDEGDEGDDVNIITFLRDLASKAHALGNNINICVSSQYHPIVLSPVGSELKIDIKHKNSDDIFALVHNTLSRHATEDVKFLTEIIYKKSSNIFLWAVIVANRISNLLLQGATTPTIKTELEKLPKTLIKLFEQLMSNLSEEDKREACWLYQWVLFRKEYNNCFGRSALQYAMLFSTKKYLSFADLYEKEETLNEDSFGRRIIHLPGGLLECIPPRAESTVVTVQVIHEHVREWLLSDGFAQLNTDLSFNLVAKSHEAILECCITVLSAPDYRKHIGWFAFLRTQPGDQVMSGYAGECVLLHALEVDKKGNLPERLLNCLFDRDHRLWANYCDCYFGFHRRSPNSPLYLLCESGFTKSVQHLLADPILTAKISTETDQYIKAWIAGHIRLIENPSAESEVLQHTASIKETCRRHFELLDNLLKSLPLSQIKDDNGISAEHWICAHAAKVSGVQVPLAEFIALIDELVRRGASIDGRDKPTVFLILEKGHSSNIWKLEIVQGLIEHGANLVWTDDQNCTSRIALHSAIISSGYKMNSHEALDLVVFGTNSTLGLSRLCLKILQEHRTQINTRDCDGNTVLHVASSRLYDEKEPIINTLVDAGASIDDTNNHGEKPLILAIKSLMAHNVKSLLNKGADPNFFDGFGNRPLHIAAKCLSHWFSAKLFCWTQTSPKEHDLKVKNLVYEIISTLLANGADPNLRDNAGKTPQAIAQGVISIDDDGDRFIKLLEPQPGNALNESCEVRG